MSLSADAPDKRTYAFDLRIYDSPVPEDMYPYSWPDAMLTLGQEMQQGNLESPDSFRWIKKGMPYATICAEMTEEEMEKFHEWARHKSWLKIIGTEILEKLE